MNYTRILVSVCHILEEKRIYFKIIHPQLSPSLFATNSNSYVRNPILQKDIIDVEGTQYDKCLNSFIIWWCSLPACVGWIVLFSYDFATRRKKVKFIGLTDLTGLQDIHDRTLHNKKLNLYEMKIALFLLDGYRYAICTGRMFCDVSWHVKL